MERVKTLNPKPGIDTPEQPRRARLGGLKFSWRLHKLESTPLSKVSPSRLARHRFPRGSDEKACTSRGMSIRRDPRVAAAVLLMAMSSTKAVAAAIVSTTSTRASSAFVRVPIRAMPQARQARSMAPAAAGLPVAGRGGFSPLLSKAPLSQAPAAAGFTALPFASRAAAGSSSSGWLWRNSATSAAGSSVRMCVNAAAAGGEVECETVQGKVIGIEGNLATVKVCPSSHMRPRTHMASLVIPAAIAPACMQIGFLVLPWTP